MSNIDDGLPKLVKYIDLQAQKLRIDLQAARLFIGTNDISNVSENAVRKFLQSILPAMYSLGVGEVIATNGESPKRIDQTQQKDVLIYDSFGSAAFGWDDGLNNLFPVESIYGVIEVKTCIHNNDDLEKAITQLLEVKELCRENLTSGQKSPLAVIFAFETKVGGSTLFDILKRKSPKERPDFVIILEQNLYFAHWHYHSRGNGPMDFVSADETAIERANPTLMQNKFLTMCKSERALLWLYLFLIEQLSNRHLNKPNLWQYAGANRINLGWIHDES